jgi:hypothetical protein
MRSTLDLNDEVLLIHPGGLGDLCVSESIILSLRHYFGPSLVAIGNERILEQFRQYFGRIDSIGSRRWSYLFSDSIDGPRWNTIILIGKDRSTSLRQRLLTIADRLFFIEMYPDEGDVRAEDFQLAQLDQCGIPAIEWFPPVRPVFRAIIYPEKKIAKIKWAPEYFLNVYHKLKEKGVSVLMVRQKGVNIPFADLDMPDRLSDVAALFTNGGLFLSSDSGMAHFAARFGLRTVTLFHDTNGNVWKPKNGVALAVKENALDVERVVDTVISLMG